MSATLPTALGFQTRDETASIQFTRIVEDCTEAPRVTNNWPHRPAGLPFLWGGLLSDRTKAFMVRYREVNDPSMHFSTSGQNPILF